MVAMTDQPELSIVIPVFNEEINIGPMYDRLLAALPDKVSGLEILYVDDGSADSSWEKISELAIRDERVRGVRFARNFGHQAALTAGVDVARGRAVVSHHRRRYAGPTGGHSADGRSLAGRF